MHPFRGEAWCLCQIAVACLSVLAVRADDLGDPVTASHHHSALSQAHAHAHSRHRLLTRPLSLRDCKREQLPSYLFSSLEGTEPVDYVFTTARGYSPYSLRPFLHTFRQYNKAARILLFVGSDQGVDLREALCETGHHYDAEFISFEVGEFFDIMMARFRAYKEILDSLEGSARNVFLTDARDVFFQSDIFSYDTMPPSQTVQLQPGMQLPYILFTTEGNNDNWKTFWRDHPNRDWVYRCFNQTVLDDVGDNLVNCAGTVLGGYTAIQAYLQLTMDVGLYVAREDCLKWVGGDQAIHNYISYWLTKHRPELVTFEVVQLFNDDSPIYTIGSIVPAQMEVTGNEVEVHNALSKLPPVVHQYDRHELLTNWSSTMYESLK